MATISISNRYASHIFTDLVNSKWTVNINFETESIFISYIREGFNPHEWEEKNKQKILISGISYKEYLNNKDN